MLLSSSQKEQTIQRANTLNSLGKIYLHAADFVHSIQCFSQCLAIADKLKDEGLTADIYRNTSIVDFHQHKYDKIKQLDSMALTIFERRKDLPKKALMLQAIGDDYLQSGDSVKATKY